MLKKTLALFLLMFLSACITRSQTSLAKVHVISSKGTTETITNKERLKSFEKEHLLSNQPYKKVIRIFHGSDATQSIITTYHTNNQIYQRLECINGQAHGSYQEWFPNGKQKIDAYVIQGSPDLEVLNQNSWIFDGESKAFDENGKLSAIFHYINGLLEGEAVSYFPSGKIREQTPYLSGNIHGTMVSYDEEGNIIQKLHYLHGLQEGLSQKYWQKNRLCFEDRFEKGKLLSGIYFDPLGNLIAQVKGGAGERVIYNEDSSYQLNQYKNGQEAGKIKIYNEKNQLINCFFQQQGIKHGEELVFNPTDQKLILSIDWNDGKIHGLVKTWYPNGQMESQKEMSHNKKQGILTAWYRDGSLMIVEEYDSDELVKGKYFKRGSAAPISIISQGKGLATLFDENGILIRKVEYFGGKPVE